MSGVVGFGTMALDTIETPTGRAGGIPGGSAVYFAAAASLLAPVHMVGVVGDDYPWEALGPLRTRGVDLSGVTSAPGPTMTWRARYDEAQRRETLGARRGVSAVALPSVPPAARRVRAVFLGSTDPRLQLEVLDQIREPELVAVDTMDHWIRGRTSEVRSVVGAGHICFVSEAEAALLGGDTRVDVAVRHILESGPDWVIVKRGGSGARAYGGAIPISVPAASVQTTVDPTGAGDAFAGGVMGHLTRAGDLGADSILEALLHGSVMGSLAVREFGIAGLVRATIEDVADGVGRLRDRLDEP